MSNVALIYINSPQVKKELIEVLGTYDFEIIEANSALELKEQHKLHREKITLYIQEFDERNKNESFGRLKIVDRESINTILLVHEVDVSVIEQASQLMIRDVVKVPFTSKSFNRRLKSFVISGDEERRSDRAVSKDEKEFDFSILKDEMIRSARGHYPVMVVSVIHSDSINSRDERFVNTMKEYLRATDRMETYSNDTILIYCPFTPKVNFEIVKNKVKNAFLDYDRDYTNINYISGLTIPDDTDNVESAIAMIESQIDDNRLFFQIDNPKKNIDLRALRSKLRKNFL